MTGSIEVICGPMFAGKSSELLRRVRRYHAVGQTAKVFKPYKDTRAGREVRTHDGTTVDAHPIMRVGEALKLGIITHCVAIDELQFFELGDHELRAMSELAGKGSRIILAGLDLDHYGAAFESVARVLPIATHVTKLTAVCLECAKLGQHVEATRTMWVAEEDYNEETRVGGLDKYQPRCISCFRPYPDRGRPTHSHELRGAVGVV